MFSQGLFRSSMRALPRQALRAVPKASPPSRHAQPFSFTAQRLQNSWRPPPPPPRRSPSLKRKSRRWGEYDQEEARSAKPLLTVEQLGKSVRSPQTKAVAIVIFVGGSLFYISHLETVPISGRRRFNCYSDATVEEEGRRMYRMIMQENQQAILPSWNPASRTVQRVMKRLIPASGMDDADWEVHVIQSDEKNAFVIPGGKVFVYSGILPIAQTEDGLAAILGHEIAHNLARHQAESMSSLVLLEPVRWIFYFLDATGYTLGLGRIIGDVLLQFGVAMPASRKQENEADHIGLMIMAKSCYDPSAALGVWQRMEAAERSSGQSIPQWLSTHPTSSNRVEALQNLLPAAQDAQEQSDCGSLTEYSRDFKGAMEDWGSKNMFRRI